MRFDSTRITHRLASFETLECRQLLSGQTPLISDAAPYSAALVSSMFRDALGRVPDTSALAWGTQMLDQGIAAETLTGSIVGSREYASKLVEAAYRQCLGREAEPAALAFWSAALAANTSDEQLIASLVASDEFYLRAGGNNAAWAAAAYQAVLNRPARASDVSAVTNQLAAGLPRGLVALSLATSLEHERDVVVDQYNRYLHITPDVGALDYWSGKLVARQTTDQGLAATLMSTSVYYQQQTGASPSTVPVPGFGPAWTALNAQIESNAGQGKAQVLFLGDSITQLWTQEGMAAWDEDFAPLGALDAGIAGDQTQNLLWRIENGDLNGISPKVVVVMIGINNVLSGDTAAMVTEGITAVVDELQVRLPNTKILLLGILPAEPLPIQPMQTVTEVNQSISALADDQTVLYFDAGSYFTNADGTLNQGLYQPMLVHPNATGYTVLASAIAPKLERLLA